MWILIGASGLDPSFAPMASVDRYDPLDGSWEALFGELRGTCFLLGEN